jgi:biotin carboxyl carrier protein
MLDSESKRHPLRHHTAQGKSKDITAVVQAMKMQNVLRAERDGR